MEIAGLLFKELFSKEKIYERVLEIAKEINRDYENKNPIFIAILNGSFIFASDLLKAIDIPCEISFMKFKSYQDLSSTGTVNQLLGLDTNINNREVIIIEDIVDTGRTLAQVFENLKDRSPKNIKICSLLFKPDAFEYNYKLDYVGFEIKNEFVIGYGLDYNGQGRNIPQILVKV